MRHQIRNVICTFRDSLPQLHPGCTEVPKTIILVKNDRSADEIIQAVRAEFDEAIDFCQKVTATEDPHTKTILADFCNSFNPRIIVTGTDITSVDCLILIRDVLPPVPAHAIGT